MMYSLQWGQTTPKISGTGMVNTHILDDSSITDEDLQADLQHYPLRRYGEPRDIALAITYLLSDAASWVTGTNLVIDGGLSLQ